MAEDVWVSALNAHPQGLAPLRGKKRLPKEEEKKTRGRDEEKGIKFSFIERFQYDLSAHMGTILRERYNFDRLEQARKAYAEAFEVDGDNILAAINDSSLEALSAVRKVIVHNGGVVDGDYLDKASYLPAALIKPIGEPIELDGEMVAGLIGPVMAKAGELIRGVDEWLLTN
jgi:hypothetical protein